jgi:hypothetical protein
MLTDDELLNLPDDPELAFAEFDKRARSQLLAALRETENSQEAEELRLRYMNHTLAAVKALSLDFLNQWEVPRIGSDTIWQSYQQFASDVDHITLQIRLRHSRRTRKYSVSLDASTKEKLRHYINEIRKVIDTLDITDLKREALNEKVSELEKEIGRNRTRFDAVMAVILEAATKTGQAAEKLAPLRKLIDSITGLIKEARDIEDASNPQLPPHRAPKQIEGPRSNSLPVRNDGGDTDDDIPF